MTAASVIDLQPTTKEGVARPAHRAMSPFDLSVMRERPNGPTAARDEPVHLPELESGQIWVIEMSPTDELPMLHRAIMTTGNVIIYDRSLEAIVVNALSLDGYAEPEAVAKTAQRCVQFGRDGWSVIRLLDLKHRRSGGSRICKSWRSAGKGLRQPIHQPSFWLQGMVRVPGA